MSGNKKAIALVVQIGVPVVALAGMLVYLHAVLDPMFSAGKLSPEAYNARVYASGIVFFGVVAVANLLAIRLSYFERLSALLGQHAALRVWIYGVLASGVLMTASLAAGLVWPSIHPRVVSCGLYGGLGGLSLASGYAGFRGTNLSTPTRGLLLGVAGLILLLVGGLMWFRS